MLFDIIDISEDELEELNVAQMKLLRTAQRNKNELILKEKKELEKFRLKLLGAEMKNSSLYDDKKAELDGELNYRCAQLADDLIYNMSVCKTEENDSDNPDGKGPTGYLVDYSLSYSERYVLVRDYYLTFKDVDERMRKFAADEIAKIYLGTYYNALYNILATYEK